MILTVIQSLQMNIVNTNTNIDLKWHNTNYVFLFVRLGLNENLGAFMNVRTQVKLNM